MLIPQANDTRMVSSLDGFWKFKVEQPNEKVDPQIALTDAMTMAVPASFNDQILDQQVRNHDGYFWYETHFSITAMQRTQRNVLHFGSVTHEAEVYINGKKIGSHVGGFTPFEFEIDDVIQTGENDLKVRVSNLLSNKTVPAAELSEKDGKYKVNPNFDFFNYAGIHRPVKI